MSRDRELGSALPPVPAPRASGNAALTVYDPRFGAPAADDEIDLRKTWDTIVRYRWTILSVMGVVLAATIVATLLMRPVFRDSALVEIRSPARTIFRMNTVEHALQARHREYLETQRRIIASESVAEAVIDRLRLDSSSEFTGELEQRGFVSGLKEFFRAIGGSSNSESKAGGAAARSEEWKLVRNFLDRLVVTPVRDSNLLEVSFESFRPSLAAEGANAVVEEYVRLNTRRRFLSASGAKEFLEREIATAQERLEDSERALNEFARRHNIVDVDEKSNLVSERVSELSSQLTAAVSDRILAESVYRQVEEGQRSSQLPPTLENDLIVKLKEKRGELAAEYKRLSSIYKTGYPKVQQLRSTIQQVDASIDREVRSVAARTGAEYERARRREALVRVELDREKDALLDLKDRAVQYHILKRDWETNRELHAGLLERMKEVGVTVGMEVNNVAIIDRAKVPIEPYRPRLLVNAAGALAVGLALGLGLAFLLAYLDDTVRTPEDFESLTGLASLGMVPKVDATEVPNGEALECLSHTRRQSTIGEALRSVRTNLLASSRRGTVRLLQVTSACVGEGKTTTATNLAVVLAQGGSRILLVDGDLRRPRLDKVFSVSLSPGLRDVLQGGSDGAIHESGIANLWVMPAGEMPPDPAELLGSMNMDVLGEGVSEAFDFVVIDSAPVLGLADSMAMGTKVDGVIVVVSAEEARRGAVREAVKRLRLVSAPLIGGVINMVDVRHSPYGYYGHYYYGYGRNASDGGARIVAT